MDQPRRVGIYGLGLIGGSLAKAIKSYLPGISLYGYDLVRGRVNMALEEGVISAPLKGKLVGDMEVIFLALPVTKSLQAAPRLIRRMAPDAVLTDCGSTKVSLCRKMEEFSDGPFFVGGHPIAGTEKAGYENGFPELFRERVVFLTPQGNTPGKAWRKVKNLWKGVGAKVIKVDAGYHDHVFAFVSHLPHAVAYSLVHSVATFDSKLPLGYSAGGFKDFTRIASSDPTMWAEIMVENREEVLRALEHYGKSVSLLSKLVREGDVSGMKRFFRISKKKRDSI
jgi:prephenate dehydrogenase